MKIGVTTNKQAIPKNGDTKTKFYNLSIKRLLGKVEFNGTFKSQKSKHKKSETFSKFVKGVSKIGCRLVTWKPPTHPAMERRILEKASSWKMTIRHEKTKNEYIE